MSDFDTTTNSANGGLPPPATEKKKAKTKKERPEPKPIAEAIAEAGLVAEIAAVIPPPLSPPKIAKPSFMSRFKSTQVADVSGIVTLQNALKLSKPGNVNDFFRTHPSELEYWTEELCFASVPIEGDPNNTMLHLILQDIAVRHLEEKEITRQRLALATKPAKGVFFFCIVPTKNLDNTWNADAANACEQAKTRWVKALSRRKAGDEGYLLRLAPEVNSFTDPEWPKQSLDDLMEVTFRKAFIDSEDHPALLRLLGKKQDLS